MSIHDRKGDPDFSIYGVTIPQRNEVKSGTSTLVRGSNVEIDFFEDNHIGHHRDLHISLKCPDMDNIEGFRRSILAWLEKNGYKNFEMHERAEDEGKRKDALVDLPDSAPQPPLPAHEPAPLSHVEAVKPHYAFEIDEKGDMTPVYKKILALKDECKVLAKIVHDWGQAKVCVKLFGDPPGNADFSAKLTTYLNENGYTGNFNIPRPEQTLSRAS